MQGLLAFLQWREQNEKLNTLTNFFLFSGLSVGQQSTRVSHYYLLLVIVTFFVTGCKMQDMGTGTGNPLWEAEPASSQLVGGHDPSYPLYTAVCDVLVDCNSDLLMGDCTNNVAALTDINEVLGLEAEAYNSFRAIYEAEERGELQRNIDMHLICEQEILNLSCENEVVIDSYAPELERPYASVREMFPEVCKGAFVQFGFLSQ